MEKPRGVEPREIISEWFGLTGGGVVKLERREERPVTPDEIRRIRRESIEALARGRGTTPKGMARLLRSFLAERKRLLIEHPDSALAVLWRGEVEGLESPLARPPTDEELT
jgi:hypothetical protein